MSFLTVDRGLAVPLTRQIYERLRALILSGGLASGTRMLSTRRLAGDLRVSRNIVLDAFDQLLAEGYIETRVGAGTFVASGAVFSARSLPGLSSVRSVGFRPFHTDLVDFRSGLPDLTRFPVGTWQRLSREVWGSLTPLDLCLRPAGGQARAAGGDRPLHRRLPGRPLPPRADPGHGRHHPGGRHREPPGPARGAPHMHPGGSRHVGHPAHYRGLRGEDPAGACRRTGPGRRCAPSARPTRLHLRHPLPPVPPGRDDADPETRGAAGIRP